MAGISSCLRQITRAFRARTMADTEICIIAATRTPIGCFQVTDTISLSQPLQFCVFYKGTLSSLSATDLGAAAIAGAIDKCKIEPSLIEEAFMGNVLSANLGQAPAKQACIKAGIPDTVPCTGVNKVCASGMKATMLGAQSIMTKQNRVVLVGGMESMSNTPHYLPNVRQGQKMGHFTCMDGMITDGLWDPYDDQHMGNFAEQCAKEYDISRQEQDSYAIQSFERAIAATDHRQQEITPVTVTDRKGKKTVINSDEGIERFHKEKLLKLTPSFQKDNGTVTAGNASQLSDGAAALILLQRAVAVKHNLPILASLVGMTDASQKPSLFTTTPSIAIKRLLDAHHLKKDDVDIYEINEAFAVVALANQKLIGLESDRVNLWGGAVAIGHPLGCSGARILVTLVHQLKVLNKLYGIAAICNGGGGASAVLIKNEI